MWTDRTEILIGKSGIKKLANSHVAVFGIGGVGGYVCMLLARSGVGKITLVDFDTVDETNLNRQVVARTDTIGKPKTDVMRQMIFAVNPKCQVCCKQVRATRDTIPSILADKCDFVVDAIDSVSSKVDLAMFCKNNNINIVSAMGAGNRIGIPNFDVIDIFKTSNDGLAKIMRKKLRENNISSLDVVTSKDGAIKTGQNVIGSISYYPAMCGCVLAAHVINKLLKGEENGNHQ